MVRPPYKEGLYHSKSKKWITTSEGWARVNRMYDLGHIPEFGSPLESVFDILFSLRQESRFIETLLMMRATMDAPLQTVEGVKVGKEMEDLLDRYTKSLFPYHEADKRKDMDVMQEQLKRWVGGTSSITVTPMPSLKDQLNVSRRTRRGRQQQEAIDQQLSGLRRKRI